MSAPEPVRSYLQVSQVSPGVSVLVEDSGCVILATSGPRVTVGDVKALMTALEIARTLGRMTADGELTENHVAAYGCRRLTEAPTDPRDDLARVRAYADELARYRDTREIGRKLRRLADGRRGDAGLA